MLSKKHERAVKRQNFGVSAELRQCHRRSGRRLSRALPAADILSMQQTRHSRSGCTAWPQPPGMEWGDRGGAYDVISLDQQKKTSVFRTLP